jgi:hypothetical protein
VRLHRGEQKFFFFEMMALIGEVTYEVERFLPVAQRWRRRGGQKFLHRGEDSFDHSMFIAQDFRGLLELMVFIRAVSMRVFHI